MGPFLGIEAGKRSNCAVLLGDATKITDTAA